MKKNPQRELHPFHHPFPYAEVANGATARDSNEVETNMGMHQLRFVYVEKCHSL